ncbi:Uncharacterized protein Fot_11618 [Forsythia ovata]|uniref:Uncharacterized protein n=1 Tax=Forsythia ovata TaxID=205694 RepID=A0ABD1WMW0_9LAMI
MARLRHCTWRRRPCLSHQVSYDRHAFAPIQILATRFNVERWSYASAWPWSASLRRKTWLQEWNPQSLMHSWPFSSAPKRIRGEGAPNSNINHYLRFLSLTKKLYNSTQKNCAIQGEKSCAIQHNSTL